MKICYFLWGLTTTAGKIDGMKRHGEKDTHTDTRTHTQAHAHTHRHTHTHTYTVEWFSWPDRHSVLRLTWFLINVGIPKHVNTLREGTVDKVPNNHITAMYIYRRLLITNNIKMD